MAFPRPSLGDGEREKYSIILAADSLYAPEHAGWLANTISAYLHGQGKVFIELPIRKTSEDEHGKLRQELGVKGLQIVEEGEEVGYDDWEEQAKRVRGGMERVEVRCWWSVWQWTS